MYASVEELEARFRPMDTQERVKAAALLCDASLMLDAECARAEASPDAGLLKVVCIDMVKRTMQAGGLPSASNLQQAAGPFSMGVTFANPTGDMYLTKANKRLLGLSAQCIGTIRPEIHTVDGGAIDGW
jgi:hypothetical protein